MKISVDIDCTPEEARRFMGLPDMAPVHDVYLNRLKSTMDTGMSPDVVAQVVRQWAPMGEAGLALWRQISEQMGPGSGKGQPPAKP